MLELLVNFAALCVCVTTICVPSIKEILPISHTVHNHDTCHVCSHYQEHLATTSEMNILPIVQEYVMCYQ